MTNTLDMVHIRRTVRGRCFGSAELCASHHYSAALDTTSVRMLIDAEQRKAAEKRRKRAPLRHPAGQGLERPCLECRLWVGTTSANIAPASGARRKGRSPVPGVVGGGARLPRMSHETQTSFGAQYEGKV